MVILSAPDSPDAGQHAGDVRVHAARFGRRVLAHGGWLRVLRNTVVGFYNQAGTRMAAALSYYSILVAGPTLVLTLWLGAMLFGETVTRDAVAQIVERALPPNTGETNALASRVVHHSTATASLAVVTGIVSLFGFTRALATSLNVTMNTDGKESLQRTALVAPLLMAAVLGLLWGAWGLEIGIDVFELFTGTADDSPFGRVLSGLVPWVLATSYFTIILAVVPRARLSRMEIFLPATFGATLWEASRQVFGWLVGGESVYIQIFGPLGVVVALLSWVYVSSAVLLLTGQFAWAFAMERRGRGRAAADAPREAGLTGRVELADADNMVNESNLS